MCFYCRHYDSSTTPTKSGGNTEFLAMWKELQKSEQKQDQQPLHPQMAHPQQMMPGSYF